MINIKYNKKREKFILINIGEAFVYDGYLYIRIPYITCIRGVDSSVEYNAVNLTNNNIAWINDEILVEPVDLDIIIKGV